MADKSKFLRFFLLFHEKENFYLEQMEGIRKKIIEISDVIFLSESDRYSATSLNNNSMSTEIYHASRLRGKVCKLVCHNSAAETVRNFMGTGVYPIHRSTLSSAYFVGMR